MPVSVSDYSKHDQQIWDEELSEFIPQRVFDAHIHMLNPAHLAAINPWEGISDMYREFCFHGGIPDDFFVPLWNSTGVNSGSTVSRSSASSSVSRTLRASASLVAMR